MVPRVIPTIAIGVVALQSAAGTFLRPSNGATAQELPVGDGRRAQEAGPLDDNLSYSYGVVYCNSFACPAGLNLVPASWEIECMDDSCTSEQCCESPEAGPDTFSFMFEDYDFGIVYCNSFACPDGLNLISGSWEIECMDDSCTSEQCCEAQDGSIPEIFSFSWEFYCNFMGCPDGFVPIENAGQVMCTDDICTPEQCCERYCSSYACPNGFAQVVDAQTVMCPDGACTDKLCCSENM